MCVSGLALSFLCILSLCIPDLSMVQLDPLIGLIYLLGLVPAVGFSICFCKADRGVMKRCPQKNEPDVVFAGRREVETRGAGLLGRAALWAGGALLAGLLADDARDGGLAALLELCLCSVVGSAGACYATEYVWSGWIVLRNRVWLGVCGAAVAVVAALLFTCLQGQPGVAFHVVFFVWPVAALGLGEGVFKRAEKAIYERTHLLARLQFETRLGMWSPR